MTLPVIYNRSLLSFANHNITDPIQYAQFITIAQRLVDNAQQSRLMAEEAESKVRSQSRCKQVKEEIMMHAWSPQRVEKLILLGYDIEDM
jgi:hypothetical protein